METNKENMSRTKDYAEVFALMHKEIGSTLQAMARRSVPIELIRDFVNKYYITHNWTFEEITAAGFNSANGAEGLNQQIADIPKMNIQQLQWFNIHYALCCSSDVLEILRARIANSIDANVTIPKTEQDKLVRYMKRTPFEEVRRLHIELHDRFNEHLFCETTADELSAVNALLLEHGWTKEEFHHRVNYDLVRSLMNKVDKLTKHQIEWLVNDHEKFLSPDDIDKLRARFEELQTIRNGGV